MTFEGARARVAGATGLAGGGVTSGEVDAAIDAAISGLSVPTDVSDLTDTTGIIPPDPTAITVHSQMTIPAGGAGTAVASGVLLNGVWEFSGTITRWIVLNDVSGTISYVLKHGATHPASTTVLTASVVGDTSASAVVSVAFTAGDFFQISIPSTATSVTLASLTLGIDREVGP